MGSYNYYTNGTLIEDGTLQLGTVYGIPNEEPLLVNAPGELDLNGFSPAVLSLNGSGSSLNSQSTDAVITNSAAALSTLNIDPVGQTSTFSGRIIGNVALYILNCHQGLTLTNTQNDYSGGTGLNDADLILGGGTSTTDGMVTGIITSYDEDHVIFDVAGTEIFTGSIVRLGDDCAFEKSGAGTLYLDPSSADTFDGTTVTGGTLVLQNTYAIYGGTGVSISGGAELDLGGLTGMPALGAVDLVDGQIVHGTLNVASGSTLTVRYGEMDASLSGNAYLDKELGSNTVPIPGIADNTVILGRDSNSIGFTGGTLVDAGILNVENSQALGSMGGVQVIDGATLQLQAPVPVAQSGLDISTIGTLTLAGTGYGGIGALNNVSGTNTWSGLIVLDTLGGDPSRINSDADTYTLELPLGIIAQNSNSPLFFGGAGNIAVGTGTTPDRSGIGLTNNYNVSTVTMDGTGDLALGFADYYTGPTVVMSGTLFVANFEALPAGTALTVAAGATVVFNSFDPNLTFASIYVSSGATLDLGGNQAATAGGLTLVDGTITDGTVYAASYWVQNGTISANLDGDGALTAAGGTVVLSGNNNYSGGTDLESGTLQLGSSNALGSPSGSLAVNGGTLDLNAFSVLVGSLNGNGGLITNSNASATSVLAIGQGGSYAGNIQDGSGAIGLSLPSGGILREAVRIASAVGSTTLEF